MAKTTKGCRQKLLSNIGEVKSTYAVVERLSKMSRKRITESTISSINKRGLSPKNIKYMTENYEEVDSELQATYLFVDSGLTNDDGVIYITFSRLNSRWIGAFVGTIKSFTMGKENKSKGVLTLADVEALENEQEVEKSKTKIPQNVSVSNTTTREVTKTDEKFAIVRTDVLEELYEKLVIKDSWKREDCGDYRSEYKPLYCYIQALVSKATYLLNKSPRCRLAKSSIAFNSDKSRMLLNTGLMNKIGSDILIMLKYNCKLAYGARLVGSKQELLDNDFDKTVVNEKIKPLILWDKPEDLIFQGNLNEFDLECERHYKHILEERLSRYPEHIKNLPIDVLYASMVKSIKSAVTISKRDTRYIIPTYNIEKDRIQFMLPFYIQESFNEKPELAIIIDKTEDYWNVMTVLGLEEAYTDAKVVNPYINGWLI